MSKLETLTESRSKEVEEHIIAQHFEKMFRKYAPKGRESEYHMDLMMMVRAIHADAAKPYEQAMNKMMQAMPLYTMMGSQK